MLYIKFLTYKCFFLFFPFYQQNGLKMFVRYFIKLVEKDVALIRCLLFLLLCVLGDVSCSFCGDDKFSYL